MPDETAPYHPLYLEGIELFNQQEFFACHDVLEELWTDTLSEECEFYQGLIQAAVALFHFGEGNLGGARRLCDSSCRYLEPYRPQCLGLDLEEFLAAFRDCFADLLAVNSGWPAGVVLDPARIPVIVLSPEAGDSTAE